MSSTKSLGSLKFLRRACSKLLVIGFFCLGYIYFPWLAVRSPSKPSGDQGGSSWEIMAAFSVLWHLSSFPLGCGCTWLSNDNEKNVNSNFPSDYDCRHTGTAWNIVLTEGHDTMLCRGIFQRPQRERRKVNGDGELDLYNPWQSVGNYVILSRPLLKVGSGW